MKRSFCLFYEKEFLYATSSTRFSTLSSEQSSLSFSIKLSNWSTKSSPNTNNTIQEVLGLIQKLKQVTAWTCKMYKYVNEHNFVQVLVCIICIKESELPVFELLVSSINYLQLQGKINVRKLELYLHILHKVVNVLQFMFGIITKRINAIIHTLFGNIRKKSVLFMEITNQEHKCMGHSQFYSSPLSSKANNIFLYVPVAQLNFRYWKI